MEHFSVSNSTEDTNGQQDDGQAPGIDFGAFLALKCETVVAIILINFPIID